MKNELKERARKNIVETLKIKVSYRHLYNVTENESYEQIAKDYLKYYQGAVSLYEDVFEEEFELTDEDREEIYGKKDMISLADCM